MKRPELLLHGSSLFFVLGAGAFSSACFAVSPLDYELSGQANLEYRYFFSEGLSGQDSHQPSVLLKPEFYWGFDDADAGITFTPFYRYDSLDNKRTHGDIRELSYINAWDDYEYRFGISSVFWGVTESVHLVDVINQTDAVEAVDGEDKLGQPMVQFTMIKDWGVTEFFYLPFFRERTFAGDDGRLRPALVLNKNLIYVNGDKARYESSREEMHGDYAVRYSHTFGDWDVGVSYLHGTDRDPYFVLSGNELVPYYAQMQHTGIDIQGFVGDWLWKLEAVYRDSYENFTAAVSGFEYTWVGAFGTIWDIGILSEYLYDSRGTDSLYAIGQNDIFAGFRFAFNDEDSTELLLGMTQDLDRSDIYLVQLEASTRLTNHFSVSLEAWDFANDTATDALYSLRKESFVELVLEYYF